MELPGHVGHSIGDGGHSVNVASKDGSSQTLGLQYDSPINKLTTSQVSNLSTILKLRVTFENFVYTNGYTNISVCSGLLPENLPRCNLSEPFYISTQTLSNTLFADVGYSFTSIAAFHPGTRRGRVATSQRSFINVSPL